MAKVKQPVIGIVNDEAAVRESLGFLLEVTGHAVETFASAADLLEAETQELTCVILNHHMPHMTGLELAERLRADGSGIPIILITGSPSPTILRQAAELGIDRVLEKPVDYGDLHNYANATRSRSNSPYPINSANTARLSQGLPIFLLTSTASESVLVDSEADFSGWHGDQRDIETFLRSQFPEAQPNRPDRTEVAWDKEIAPPKAASQPIIALKMKAAELADRYAMRKQQTEAVSGALMAVAASDDGAKPEPAIGSQALPLTGSDLAAISSNTIPPVIDAEGNLTTKGRSASDEKNEAARNAAIHKLIAERAYEMWENHGRPHGYDLIDWLQAEQEIKGCLEYGSVQHGGEPGRH
jgi:CheY-like chemotaxis protein